MARQVLQSFPMKTSLPPEPRNWGDLPMPPPRRVTADRPRRILVAEGDGELRQLVLESLQKDGHDVVEVADGNQLLIRITSHYRLRPDPEPIDLIVTDIRMPVVSGLDIVRSLRDAQWSTPVVMITAFADVETRAQATELGGVLLISPSRWPPCAGASGTSCVPRAGPSRPGVSHKDSPVSNRPAPSPRSAWIHGHQHWHDDC
jgi:CheY-like chemotaxis protein